MKLSKSRLARVERIVSLRLDDHAVEMVFDRATENAMIRDSIERAALAGDIGAARLFLDNFCSDQGDDGPVLSDRLLALLAAREKLLRELEV